ncbi:DNA topoisomerase III, partial [Bacteroides cellulosilyticus]
TVRGMKVADASLTSGWEAELARIEQGELTQKEFLDGVLETVNEVTGEIFRKLSEDERPHGSI